MDSDFAAHAKRMAVFVRHRAAVAQLLVAAAVEQVWIVEGQEPIPAAAGMLLDDCVNAFGGAPVPFPQFRAGLEAASEHGVVVLKHPAFVIEGELVALFEINTDQLSGSMKEISRVALKRSWPGVGTQSVRTLSIFTCAGGVGVAVGVRVRVARGSGGSGVGIPGSTYFTFASIGS